MSSINLTPNSSGEPESESIGGSEFNLREAISSLNRNKSYEERMNKVRQACSKQFSETSSGGGCGMDSMMQNAYVEHTWDDAVVFKKGDKLYSADYEISDDGEVEFGEPQEIEPTFTPKKGKLKESEIALLAECACEEANTSSSNTPYMGHRRKRVEEKKPPIGTGQRFASLRNKIASKGNVSDPGAVAAAIGRKKYGKKRFAKLSAKGRKDASK